MAEAKRLAQAGRAGDARALVEQAGEAGDTEALLALAHWRLFGLYGPRDLSAAHKLLARAGAAGSAEAVRIRATLIGNGTGCAPDLAEAARLLATIAAQDGYASFQLAFLPRLMPDDRVASLRQETLSADPPIRIVRGLLTEPECRFLMTIAEPKLEMSHIIDQQGVRRPHPTRTSMGMSFGPLDEDLIVRRLNIRLAAVTGTKVDWGEPLHILRYAPGQEYRPHLDVLPGIANQRRWTVLVYLTADYSGGETQFDRLGLAARGGVGDALIFGSLARDGSPDQRTRHAGLPVLSGVKWLATRWIRGAPYHPWAAG
jgi:prolyl 4-hydroxylase